MVDGITPGKTGTSVPAEGSEPSVRSPVPVVGSAVGGGAGFGAGFASSFSDIFEDLFGMAGQRGRGGRERGADLRYNMEITLEEAFGGKTAQIEIPVSVTCEAFSGTGAKAGTKPKTCATCGGAGRVRQSQGFFTLERTCPGCQGRGQMIEDAVDHAGLSTLKKSMRDIQILGNDDGGRDVLFILQFVGAGAENHPKQGFQPVHGPILGQRGSDQTIQFFLPGGDAVYQVVQPLLVGFGQRCVFTVFGAIAVTLTPPFQEKFL